ncbi:MAG: sortase [Bifidobacteriaceae bacterium]|jgi:sortase A|nr:sortase [Bifidobacteriaceae bacterium]
MSELINSTPPLPPKYSKNLYILIGTIFINIILCLLIIADISLFIRYNQIDEKISFLPNSKTVINSDELVSIINSTVQNEIFADTDFKLSDYDLTVQIVKPNQDNINQNSILINSVALAIYPSCDSIEAGLKTFFDNKKIPISDEISSNISEISANTNIRYATLIQQLAQPEQNIADDLNHQIVTINIVIIILLTLIIILIILYNQISIKESKQIKKIADTPSKKINALIKITPIKLIIYNLCIIITAIVLAFPISNIIVPNIKPSNYSIDISQNIATPFDMNVNTGEENTPITFIDPPNKPLYMEPFGSIDVPSQALHKDIIEGANDDAIKNQPGHFSFSAWPGELGPVIIEGHNQSYFGKGTGWLPDFGKIWYLNLGDLFTITTDYGVFTYKVTDKHVQSADSFKILERVLERDHRFAILYTCYPLNSVHAVDRAIITGEQIAGPIILEDKD